MNNSKSKGNIKIPKPKKNLTGMIVFGIITIILSVVIFIGITSALETETFYVLNRDVQSQEMITPDMLTQQITSAGGSPQNAIGMGEVQRGGIYARIPLMRGDILSPSNVSRGDSVGVGIPDEWVITSFNINADHAAGGTIRRGEYFDILGINNEGARYIFINVLALDVSSTFNQNTIDGQTTFGQEMRYIVGMPPEDAALLHASIRQFDEIRLVRSPAIIHYDTRDSSGLMRLFRFSADLAVRDLFRGTDATFSEILRDANGRPVNARNCFNELIYPMSLCDNIDFRNFVDDRVDEFPPEVEIILEAPEPEENENNVENNIPESNEPEEPVEHPENGNDYDTNGEDTNAAE